MSAGVEGTLFAVLSVPFPWPPSGDFTIVQQPVKGTVVTLGADSDGRMKLVVKEPSGAVLFSFTSQRVTIKNPGLVIFAARWSSLDVNIYINKDVLLADSPGVPTLFVAPKQTPVGDSSIDNPLAAALCKTWVDNRNARFSIAKVA